MGLLLLGTFGVGIIGVEASTQSLRLWLAGGLLMVSVLLGFIGIILVGILLCTRRWKDAFQLVPDIVVSLLPTIAYIAILRSLGSD